MASRVWLVFIVTLLGAPAAEGDETKARQIYTEGEAAFSGGRYKEAARDFEAAFAESRYPSLLWNVAQSYRKQYELDRDVVNLRRASAVYQNYRELLPPEANRAEVDAALAAVTRGEIFLNTTH